MNIDISFINPYRDDQGHVRLLNHVQNPQFSTDGALDPLKLAIEYTNAVAPFYQIAPELLNLDLPLPPKDQIDTSKFELYFQDILKQEQTLAVVSYAQTFFNLPIWRTGLTVVMSTSPLRVLNSNSSIHYNIMISPPSKTALDGYPNYNEAALSEALFGSALSKTAKITDRRLLIYQYIAADRIVVSGPSDSHQHPTLPLPPVPEGILDGNHYVVQEVLFSLALPVFGNLHWLALIELETNTVLYLRALIEFANAPAMVYKTDPLTNGDVGMDVNQSNAALNPLRVDVMLDVDAPASAGSPMKFSGAYVKVDINGRLPVPPLALNYDVRSADFANTNAYYHCHNCFQMTADLGISATYWGVQFAGGYQINLDPEYDQGTMGGYTSPDASATHIETLSFYTNFPHAAEGELSYALDRRVALHEFGHVVLFSQMKPSMNFEFAHSCGDSFAAILSDPESQITGPNRFITFPWTKLVDDQTPEQPRRHDRGTAAWAWGGLNDSPEGNQPSYRSEQILSTTLFRLYRAIGGDSTDPVRKDLAARFATFMILMGVYNYTNNSFGRVALGFEHSLEAADMLPFGSYAAGAYHKVTRWAFEQQGMVFPPSVTAPAPAPNIDVYIDDGRHGGYEYLPVFWQTADIWSRQAADGGTTHQTPIVGQPNFAYVRVRNRGSETARQVTVKAFHTLPAAGAMFPVDWTPMTTAALPVADIPTGGVVIAGPFQWTPTTVGHECLLMSVSGHHATNPELNDLSNVDLRALHGITAPIEDWRLVPNDNNIAQRNVAPITGGSGSAVLLAAISVMPFLVRNRIHKKVTVSINIHMPRFLHDKKWHIAPPKPFPLGPGETREVTFHDSAYKGPVKKLLKISKPHPPVLIGITAGMEFTPKEIRDLKDPATIIVEVRMDGMVIGGMSYIIDPDMK